MMWKSEVRRKKKLIIIGEIMFVNTFDCDNVLTMNNEFISTHDHAWSVTLSTPMQVNEVHENVILHALQQGNH